MARVICTWRRDCCEVGERRVEPSSGEAESWRGGRGLRTLDGERRRGEGVRGVSESYISSTGVIRFSCFFGVWRSTSGFSASTVAEMPLSEGFGDFALVASFRGRPRGAFGTPIVVPVSLSDLVEYAACDPNAPLVPKLPRATLCLPSQHFSSNAII